MFLAIKTAFLPDLQKGALAGKLRTLLESIGQTTIPKANVNLAFPQPAKRPPQKLDLRYSSQTSGSPIRLGRAGEISVYKVVRTSRLYEQIVQQIEESVLNGALKPGDQLPAERELAQQLGVSRTAVREAVKALREKGLVEAYSGRGTFITDGTSHAARQSFDLMVKIGQQEGSTHLAELRLILEPGIAALAAERAEEEHLAAMREAVTVMDRAQKDPAAYIEADLDFHLALAEAVANPLILSLIDSIVGLLREQRIKIFNVEGGPQRGQVHHKRILEAMEQRDAGMARTAMSGHLEQVRRDSQVTNNKASRKNASKGENLISRNTKSS
jgi:GntR family transcriptional regulator, transcriptional repressor for pyruvate dehydrogenase complex